MNQYKYTYFLESIVSALGVIIRAFVIAILVMVLLESSLHYRRKQPTLLPDPVVLQYNFTNNQGEENTLVIMS